MFYFILLVAFHSLSNTNNVNSGGLNGLVMFVVIILVDRAVNRADDNASQKQSLDAVVEEVLLSSKSKLAYLKRQVEIGWSLVNQMRHNESAVLGEIRAGFPTDNKGMTPWKESQNSQWYHMGHTAQKISLVSHSAKAIVTDLLSPGRYLRTDCSGPGGSSAHGGKDATEGTILLQTVVLRSEMDTSLLGADNITDQVVTLLGASGARFRVDL
jgi:hypothetical protein